MATRKTTTRKKTAEKPAIVIDEDIEIGMLELPDSKGIRVALIRSAGKRYVAINRMYKSKTEGVWKHRNAIWLPYDKSYNIAGLIKLAYIEGLKRHWDQPYEEPAATPTGIRLGPRLNRSMTDTASTKTCATFCASIWK